MAVKCYVIVVEFGVFAVAFIVRTINNFLFAVDNCVIVDEFGVIALEFD